jgi:hypothetical protein
MSDVGLPHGSSGDPEPDGPAGVILDVEGVTHRFADGRTERVRWDDLTDVAIVTTDEGPWGEDVFWVLTGAGLKSGCIIPGSAEGVDRLLQRLQELPGFDNEAVIAAMASADHASFPVWKRPG